VSSHEDRIEHHPGDTDGDRDEGSNLAFRLALAPPHGRDDRTAVEAAIFATPHPLRLGRGVSKMTAKAERESGSGGAKAGSSGGQVRGSIQSVQVSGSNLKVEEGRKGAVGVA
jgi:hypothetical protein